MTLARRETELHRLCLLSRETNLQEVEATPFPPWMHELLKDVMPLCGFSEEDRTVTPPEI